MGCEPKRYIKITTTHSQVLILFGVGNLLSLFTSLSSLKCMHIFTYAMHISHLASRSKEGRILQGWKKLCHPKRKVFPSRNILRSPGDNTLHHRSSPPCRRSFRGTLFRPLYVVTNSKLANCPRGSGAGRQG